MGNGSFKSNYKVKEKLGQGAFAVVKRCTSKKDGQDYAVKIIDKPKLSERDLKFAHDEVIMMKDIDHEHCIKMYDVYETSNHVYIVIELLEGGELFERLVNTGSLSEQHAADVIRQLTGALAYLHGIGIVHRDLKPENLLYDNKGPDAKIKITDFGLAKYQQGDQELMSTACGSPAYVAPEILKGEKYDGQVDMWSLGVILYVMLCAFPPFVGKPNSELYKRIKAGRFSFPEPEWTHISKEAKSLVAGLLTLDPKRRLTPEQVLQHPWLTGAVSGASFPEQHLVRLRRLAAKRKFRSSVQSVIAIERMRKLVGGGPSDSGRLSGSESEGAAEGTAAAPAAAAPAGAPALPARPAVNIALLLRQLSAVAEAGRLSAEDKAELKALILSRNVEDAYKAAARLQAFVGVDC